MTVDYDWRERAREVDVVCNLERGGVQKIDISI